MFAPALPVYAQESPPTVSVGAHGDALELGVGAGATGGWGTFGTSNVAPIRTPGGGGALELEPSWRALPVLGVGVYGWGAQLSETAALPSPGDALQAGAGIQGTLHFAPSAPKLDPWLSLGSGWRGQWLDYVGPGSIAQNGWDFVRARAGVDARVSPTLALAPVVGASLTRYYTEQFPGVPWSSIPSAGLDVYVFAGVRATLDYALHPRRP
jgi:hypothetical protein